MRPLAALALVACSSPARAPVPVAPTRPPTPVVADAPPEQRPIPTVHAARDVAEAPHGGQIMTLALAPDGKAALSADELGGVRLWPALDGSAEPRIVDMPVAKQLAVGRSAGGFSAVALDEAGGLYVAALDDAGRQLSHTTLPADPAATSIAMSTAGLVATRADQTIVLLDRDGATKSKLGTEPQQRLIALAVNGSRAVAVLERDGTKRQARWLQLAPKLAWGGWLALDSELAGSVDLALSPSGKRIAALVRTDRTNTAAAVASALVFDAATGKVLANTPFSAVADIGFADDDHVAIGGLVGVSWLDLTVTKPALSPNVPSSPGSRAEAAFGAGAGHAVTALNGELVISTPATTEFLGYETVSPRIAEVGPDGGLLVGVGDHMLLLDRDLRPRAGTSPFTGLTGMVAELRWLGEDDWLVESSTPNDPALQVTLVNPSQGNTVVRRGIKEVQVLDYEPSTQQVTLSFGAETEVARFDRKTRKLDRLGGIKKTSAYEQVLFVPVSPALARGTQLVQVSMKERSTVKWLRDPAALDKPSATVTVDGPFAGADTAGHVFMWRNTPSGQLELAVYEDGKLLRTLPNSGAIALWPEPSGKRYVEVAASSVALYDDAGKQLWLQQLATSQEALWLTDGSIAITSAGGIARLDPATGAVVAARCGWRFSLAVKPHPATPRVEPLCSQLRR